MAAFRLMRDWRGAAVCAGLLLVAVVYFRPLLGCQGACTIDLERWSGERSANVELAQDDTRLNTWILAWVQHALTTSPAHLFDGNVFHPAPRALAGSEHMLGAAVLGLPLRVYSSDASAEYNAVLVLSFVIAGVATYAFAAWLTGSHWLGAWAGLMAMFMPWRLTELAHLQLLFAAWLPAVWLGIAKCLLEEPTRGRLAALAASWAALIFSSYYLAYFGCFTGAVLIVAILLTNKVAAHRLLRTSAALALPLVALALLSLPYLEARKHAELVQTKNAIVTVAPGMVFAALAPVRAVMPRLHLPWDASYSLPALALVLAACVLLPRRQSNGAPALIDARVRSLSAGLIAVCVLAIVMSIGQHLRVAGVDVPLPALWAARITPGFDLMRAPLRWLLVVAVALPLLAAIGLQRLEGLLGRALAAITADTTVRTRASRAVAAALAILALVPMVTPPPPTMAAYPHEGHKLEAYGSLAELPFGPVLEVPWPRQAQAEASLSSMYMVASTHHWRPLLNGYTAYKPRSYPFLIRAAARLPERSAVERMSALTGLRWIVVHLDKLEDWEADPWIDAQVHGPLAPAYRNSDTVIYELVDWQKGGTLRERLFSQQRFARTISGLDRSALELKKDDGALSAPFPLVLNRYADGWASQGVPLRITNASERPWPAIDPDPEGLVHVRYSLRDTRDEEVLSGVVALDDDIPARGALMTNVAVQGNLAEGVLRLRLELVQRIAEQWRLLPIAPVEGEARVIAQR